MTIDDLNCSLIYFFSVFMALFLNLFPDLLKSPVARVNRVQHVRSQLHTPLPYFLFAGIQRPGNSWKTHLEALCFHLQDLSLPVWLHSFSPFSASQILLPRSRPPFSSLSWTHSLQNFAHLNFTMGLSKSLSSCSPRTIIFFCYLATYDHHYVLFVLLLSRISSRPTS